MSPKGTLLAPKESLTPLLPPAIVPLAPPFPGIGIMESEFRERAITIVKGVLPAKSSAKASLNPTISPTSSATTTSSSSPTAAVSQLISSASGALGAPRAVGPPGPAGPRGIEGISRYQPTESA